MYALALNHREFIRTNYPMIDLGSIAIEFEAYFVEHEEFRINPEKPFQA